MHTQPKFDYCYQRYSNSLSVSVVIIAYAPKMLKAIGMLKKLFWLEKVFWLEFQFWNLKTSASMKLEMRC